jgi:predicted metal-dependent hydrolase
MEYILKRKRIKNMYARLDKDNNLVITAPYLVPLKTIERFALESYEKLSKRKEKKPNKSIFNSNGEVKILGNYVQIDNLSELNAILLKNLKDYLNKNYLNIVNMMGISNVPSVKIKKVKNYLGQYNKKTNNINLNLLLGHMEEELIEYVIIHELAHTRYMDHQVGFWKEVSKYCPYYKTYRTKCKKEFVYYENY